MRPILVLISNDQEWSARSIESVLEPNGYAILRAHTGEQTLERARAARPDMLILDAQLPDVHGFEVCRILRRDPAIGHTVPIIITTAGPAGRQQRLEASRAGAWELFGQPLDSELLLHRLRAFANAVTEVRALREEGLVDTRTGLYNARGLVRRGLELGAEATRGRLALACVVIGSSPAGDGAVLSSKIGTEIATALQQACRSSDALGLLGPDEFAILLPHTGPDTAQRLAERFGAAVERVLGTRHLPIRVGVSAVDDFALAGIGVDELMARAVAVRSTVPLAPEVPLT